MLQRRSPRATHSKIFSRAFIETLIGALTNPELAPAAASALASLTASPERTIPALMQAVQVMPDIKARKAVINAIGRYEQDAAQSVALLKKVMENDPTELRL